MNSYCKFTNEMIQRFNMLDSITVNEYLYSKRDAMSKVPSKSGVYFIVLNNPDDEDIFINPGTGGYYKGEDPNVGIEVLRDNWVKGADILYIGKAGGIRKNGVPYQTELKTRIRTLLKFGNNIDAAHRGGKYLWQHRNSKNFRIYWYVCKEHENAVVLERELLDEFENVYGKLPFANLG
ncbi:hypothetical protein [Peptoclostridium acidaminophilum]|uniref:hypothetical protein n=1 Tax=Peptoclostridium acidaminophilum TaxID=1731 RepID=UPI00046D6276|nr:hypothetical protein [Peptoclostridium acidaminophilum]